MTPAITHQDLAVLVARDAPFDRAGWVFELKYDGFRCLASNVGEIRLMSRKGNPLDEAFPELVASVAKLPPIVLDGELVVLDAQGRPDFGTLARRGAMRQKAVISQVVREAPAALFAFDLLWLKGKDMRALPLLKRKAALQKVLGKAPGQIVYLSHVEEQGVALFKMVAGIGLEGIVAKRADAPYVAGRSGWLKIKTPAGRAAQAARSKAWDR